MTAFFPAVDIRSVFSCGLNLGYFNVYVAVGLLSAFNLRYLDGTPAVAARVLYPLSFMKPRFQIGLFRL